MILTQLRRLREDALLSQEALARLADISRQTVTVAEGGQTVTPRVIRKLAAALAVEPAALWTATKETA